MSRGPRLILENASYHILIRGNQKQVIFIEEADFTKYLDLIRHYKQKYRFKLYGYCLMPNHVHLILEIKNGCHLGKVMQGVNLTYAQWFNKKYKKVGHLWQGRYKSLVIEKNQYMLSCIEYVELNPIRAGLANSPFDYPWSSRKTRFSQENSWILDHPDFI